MNSVPEEAVALELVCPAGNPAALEAAVVAGDDVVYAGCTSDSIPRAKVSNLVAAKLPATPVVVIQAAVDAA